MKDKTDSELISYALSLWANYIETGMVTMSAADCSNNGLKPRCKVLEPEEIDKVNRLRVLSERHKL